MPSKRRTSKASRQNPLLVRGEYNGNNPWDIPLMKVCHINDPNLKFVSFQSTGPKDTGNFDKAVHFFIDDYKFEKVYSRPDDYIRKLAHYKYVLTPDFSLFTDMPLWLQINNVARNRWCGRNWQEVGLEVIPTVGWSTPESYSFAFLGLEKGTTVAVSTVGAKQGDKKSLFIQGYNAMIEEVKPNAVYCYGKPLQEMQGNVFHIDYLETTRRCG